jgi:site-specific recombinase XerD
MIQQKLTLSQLAERFFEDQRGMISENTAVRYKTTTDNIIAVIGDKALADLTLADLRAWRGSLFDRGLKRPTVDSYIRSVRRVFNWAVDCRLIQSDDNLPKRLEKPHLGRGEPKAVSLADIKAALTLLAEKERWGLEAAAGIARDRAIILLLADSGCRAGELCSITHGRLDLADLRAMVYGKGKGGAKPRLIFFGEKTAMAIRSWLYYHPTWAEADDNTAVFVGLFGRHHGQPLSVNGVYQLLGRRAEEAGLKGRFHPHAFRHAAAREWLRNGADLSTVSQLLGHASVAVTDRHYAVWAQGELAGHHQRLAYVDRLNGHA